MLRKKSDVDNYVKNLFQDFNDEMVSELKICSNSFPVLLCFLDIIEMFLMNFCNCVIC